MLRVANLKTISMSCSMKSTEISAGNAAITPHNAALSCLATPAAGSRLALDARRRLRRSRRAVGQQRGHPEGPAQPGPAPLGRRQPRNVLALEREPRCSGLELAGELVEQRRLARGSGSDQGVAR